MIVNENEEQIMDDRRKWHFERRITLGELLTAIALLAMIYAKGNSIIDEFRTSNSQMDKRVAILEEKANMQKQIDTVQDDNTRQGQQRIEASLSEIQRFLRDHQTPVTLQH